MALRRLLISLLAFLGSGLTNQANAQATISPDSPLVEAKIYVSESSVIVAGGSIRVRVEIWNMGSRDIFICKDFQATYTGYCSLRFTLSGPKGSYGAETASASDEFPVKTEEFCQTLYKNWILIPPKHFYGTIVELSADTYPILLKPGHYILKAEYNSAGLLLDSYSNSLLAHRDDVEHLPYKAWQGTVYSNQIEVTIRPEKK